MSGVFQGLMDVNGRLPVGVGPITYYFRGLPFNALNQVVYGSAPIVRYNQGVPFNASGEIVGLQATQATDYGPGAMPYGPNGEIEVGVLGPAFFHQGVGFTAGGVLAVTAAGGAPVIVSKEFTLTPAQISSSSAGFRASPAAGTIAPDAVYAGGTVVLVQATNADEFRVQNTGSVQFPDITGNLAVQIGPYIGPNRIVAAWDGVYYSAVISGIYAYMVDQIGLPTGLRFSAAPVAIFLNMDNDNFPDVELSSVGGVHITMDEDSVNIDFNGDGVVDATVIRPPEPKSNV